MEDQMGAVNADTVSMLGMFSELTLPLIEEIRANFEAGDAKALEESGHSLKGSARSACCMILGDFASDLQDKARDIENCGELVANIEQEFANVRTAIAKLQEEYS
jgi:two-component system sensor histidine kinase/response regulator